MFEEVETVIIGGGQAGLADEVRQSLQAARARWLGTAPNSPELAAVERLVSATSNGGSADEAC